MVHGGRTYGQHPSGAQSACLLAHGSDGHHGQERTYEEGEGEGEGGTLISDGEMLDAGFGRGILSTTIVRTEGVSIASAALRKNIANVSEKSLLNNGDVLKIPSNALFLLVFPLPFPLRPPPSARRRPMGSRPPPGRRVEWPLPLRPSARRHCRRSGRRRRHLCRETDGREENEA